MEGELDALWEERAEMAAERAEMAERVETAAERAEMVVEMDSLRAANRGMLCSILLSVVMLREQPYASTHAYDRIPTLLYHTITLPSVFLHLRTYLYVRGPYRHE
jgi:hypothetical protein